MLISRERIFYDLRLGDRAKHGNGLIHVSKSSCICVDIPHEMVFDMLIADLRARGERFEIPGDPLTDKAFIGLLTRIYDPGAPKSFPPEPQEPLAA